MQMGPCYIELKRICVAEDIAKELEEKQRNAVQHVVTFHFIFHRPIHVIRFIGITPQSSNIRDLLYSICEQVHYLVTTPPPPHNPHPWKICKHVDPSPFPHY